MWLCRILRQSSIFAHTIGPMFTVIILPARPWAGAVHQSAVCGSAAARVCDNQCPVAPACHEGGKVGGHAVQDKAREIKSLVLESVYGIKDIRYLVLG